MENHLTWGGFSEDGVNFTVDRSGPWLDPGSDIAGDILWNREAGLYQLFVRPVYGDRRVAMSTTTDFTDFTRPVTIMQPDPLDRVGTELYDMPPRPYEDFYIGLLNIFTTDRFEEVSLSSNWPQIKYLGRMDTQLAYSYNGLYWYRTEREPFIGLHDYGLPGGGSAYGKEMLRTPDDKLLFFVISDYGGHAARVDKKDRMGIRRRLPQPDDLRDAARRLLLAEDLGARGGAAHKGYHPSRRRHAAERAHDGAHRNPRADARRNDRAANPWLHMGGGGYDQRRPSPRPPALARAG